MDDKTREILVITQEEAAEVIQEISKIFRFGIDEQHKDGVPHRKKLEMEIGDFLAMIDLLVQHGAIDPAQLEGHKAKKIEKLRIWSSIFDK